MTRYRLSAAADRDIEELLRSTADRWGLRQAEAYGEGHHRTFEILAGTPDPGRAVDEVRPGHRRFGFGAHLVFDRVVPDGILVGRVLHGRMDARRRLGSAGPH